MATATKRAFKAPCIKCAAENGVHVFLCDLGTFYCQECNEEWTVDDVRSLIVQWGTILTWLDAAPLAD